MDVAEGKPMSAHDVISGAAGVRRVEGTDENGRPNRMTASKNESSEASKSTLTLTGRSALCCFLVSTMEAKGLSAPDFPHCVVR
jgi:hypothetical protein